MWSFVATALEMWKYFDPQTCKIICGHTNGQLTERLTNRLLEWLLTPFQTFRGIIIHCLHLCCRFEPAYFPAAGIVGKSWPHEVTNTQLQRPMLDQLLWRIIDSRNIIRNEYYPNIYKCIILHTLVFETSYLKLLRIAVHIHYRQQLTIAMFND